MPRQQGPDMIARIQVPSPHLPPCQQNSEGVETGEAVTHPFLPRSKNMWYINYRRRSLYVVLAWC